MGRRGWGLGIATSIAAVTALMAAPAASATTYTVTSLADSGPNTLREALTQANDGVNRADVINITATGQIVTLSQLPIDPAATDGALDINGPGATQLDVHRSGGPNFIIFGVASGADASISGIKISGGSSPSSGGGIFQFGGVLDLTDVEVSGNSVSGPADTGGGIHTTGTGTLTVRRSAIVGNSSAGGGGGGISVGGGSTVLVERSTISGNTTTGLSAGGVRVSGTDSTMTIRSSTVADNTGNATVSVGKNVSADNSGQIILQNTILADPHTPTPADTPPNCGISSATIASLGFNLADDASCNLIAAGDKPSTDPGLAALALNSGTTRTHAIAKTSAATDAGLAGLAMGAFDQRGLTRPVDFSDVANAVGGDATDIGAFEVQLPPAPCGTCGVTPPPVKKCKKGRKLKKGKCVKKKRKKKRK